MRRDLVVKRLRFGFALAHQPLEFPDMPFEFLDPLGARGERVVRAPRALIERGLLFEPAGLGGGGLLFKGDDLLVQGFCIRLALGHQLL